MRVSRIVPGIPEAECIDSDYGGLRRTRRAELGLDALMLPHVRASATRRASSAFAECRRQQRNGDSRGHPGADAPAQIGAQSRVRLLYTVVAGIALALHPDDPRGAAL